MPKTKEILCFSNLPWADRMTRRQMIMSRMRDVRIVWMDPPDGRFSVRGKRPGPTKPYPHITVYSSAGFLSPDSPAFKADPFRGRKAYLAYIGGILKKEEMSSPLLWLYSPAFAPLAEGIWHDGLVYDCADLPEYGSGKKKAAAEKETVALCRRADVVFTARRDLYRKLECFNLRTYLLPNGIDYRPKKTAEPLTAGYARPVVGFAGDLSAGVDLELLRRAAETCGGTLVLVTTGEMRDRLPREDYLRLTSCEKVVPLAVESQPAILDAVSEFDAVVAPYREGAEESDLRSRVFYACLASGKPVISTKHGEILDSFPGCAYAAEDEAGFLDLLKAALSGDDPVRRSRQLAYADGCRWEARVSEIRRLLAREGYLVD